MCIRDRAKASLSQRGALAQRPRSALGEKAKDAEGQADALGRWDNDNAFRGAGGGSNVEQDPTAL
eukprot:7787237-Alexandrium_andersonii.AAC.1